MGLLSLGQQAWMFANKAFAFVWFCFDQLLRASGMKIYWLAVFFFALAFRLLAAPLVGAGLSVGSDTYRAMRAKTPPMSDSKEIRRLY